MERVIVTRPVYGIVTMQVCCVKDATDEEILEVCNRLNPSGTSGGWGIVVRNGEPEINNPVPCCDHKDRIHILIHC